jgi:hypothetical protein
VHRDEAREYQYSASAEHGDSGGEAGARIGEPGVAVEWQRGVAGGASQYDVNCCVLVDLVLLKRGGREVETETEKQMIRQATARAALSVPAAPSPAPPGGVRHHLYRMRVRARRRCPLSLALHGIVPS